MLVFVFKQKPEGQWLEAARRYSFEIYTADQIPPIGGKFVVVVGDEELAKRIGAAFFTEEEAEEFLKSLGSHQAG
ncbi:MAG: hypothetical protein ABWK05_06555 [Pyrobaculum sp.]